MHASSRDFVRLLAVEEEQVAQEPLPLVLLPPPQWVLRMLLLGVEWC